MGLDWGTLAQHPQASSRVAAATQATGEAFREAAAANKATDISQPQQLGGDYLGHQRPHEHKDPALCS